MRVIRQAERARSNTVLLPMLPELFFKIRFFACLTRLKTVCCEITFTLKKSEPLLFPNGFESCFCVEQHAHNNSNLSFL